ncbi:MAG: NAD(P)H-hydrate dehydratase, partial [Deltaproteobacteria bacterium]|nr:NAD(P)H-hydrate dehydratase [Deltaproteobacteria bacterium]
FTRRHLKEVLRLTRKASVVALGPGLGLQKETVRFVHEFVRKYSGPLIVDADGLNALALKLSVAKKRKGETLFTPHPGEMSLLTGKTVAWIQKNRTKVAHDFAVTYRVHLLLKGYRSVFAFPDGKVWINPTGNPAMAQGGQGDALTGIFAGLVSEFGWKRPALLAAPYIHGLVGDRLAKKGKRTVLASDILKNLGMGYR